MIDERLLKQEEKAVYALRALYRRFGYLPYKMSKFEEYDLYVRNKDFLVSDRVITFNDTNGKLMALKPDVTLSILKYGEDRPGYKQKLCYNENVYRVNRGTGQFKEIVQAGLECIGDLDAYDIFEVVCLAVRSLEQISDDYVLDLSHLGLMTALLDGITTEEKLRQTILHDIAEKNTHDLERLCRENGVEEAKLSELSLFAGLYGRLGEVLPVLRPYCVSETAAASWRQLDDLNRMLAALHCDERVCFDFSIVNDMNYYNGIVFKGFVQGICEGVLAGGQYDKLAARMGRKAGAVGFAVYLDLLEELRSGARSYDVDCLLLYDADTPAESVSAAVQGLTAEGSVSAQRTIPEKLRYRRLVDIRGGGGI